MSSKNKQRRIKLIANSNAGDPAKTANNLEMAGRYLQENGLKVDLAIAQPKKEVGPIVRNAVKAGYKTLLVMGGDGTIEACIRALMSTKAGRESKIHLGILPSGTANNIAKSIGIPEDMQYACQMIADDVVCKMDVGRVRVQKHKPFYFFELTAIGLTAALYPEMTDIQKGKLSGIKDAVTTFIKHETHPTIQLTLDGESKLKTETFLVTVSNTPVFGMNLLVSPQASLQDSLLDVSIYPSFAKADLIAYYARVMHEGKDENKSIQRYRAHKLKVKASPRLDVMADGEMLGKGTVRIKTLPGVLRVIVPKHASGLAAQLPAKEAELVLPTPLPVPVS